MTAEEQVLQKVAELIVGTEWENRVWLAGGAVRDQFMGLKPKDLDFLVTGNLTAGVDFAEWLGKTFGNYRAESNPVIYERFGTAKLSTAYNKLGLPEIELEFVAPRKEVYTAGSRNPEVIAGTIEDDARRRDFRINSLLKNINTQEIYDVTGQGISDIGIGLIMPTSAPAVIFKQDPLRMLRAVRFSVKLGFTLDARAGVNIQRNNRLLTTISMERIRDEFDKILVSADPAEGVRMLYHLGLLQHFIPEFLPAVGMTQNIYHTQDVFDHCLEVMSKTPADLTTRLIALFHDIGKTVTKTTDAEGNVHFYGHEYEGEKMVRIIMERMKYPNDLIDKVCLGVECHMMLKYGGNDASAISDKSLRKFRARAIDVIVPLLDVMHSDNICHSEHGAMPDQIRIVAERLSVLGEAAPAKPKLPITGDDLIKMGLKPGPEFKRLLGFVEEAWYENPEITREEAVKIVQDNLEVA